MTSWYAVLRKIAIIFIMKVLIAIFSVEGNVN